MVRLKDFAIERACFFEAISIPYGAIKRLSFDCISSLLL